MTTQDGKKAYITGYFLFREMKALELSKENKLQVTLSRAFIDITAEEYLSNEELSSILSKLTIKIMRNIMVIYMRGSTKIGVF